MKKGKMHNTTGIVKKERWYVHASDGRKTKRLF